MAAAAITIEAIVQTDHSSNGDFPGPQTLLGNETDHAGLAIGCRWNSWFCCIHSADVPKHGAEARGGDGPHGQSGSRTRTTHDIASTGDAPRRRRPTRHHGPMSPPCTTGRRCSLFVAGRLRGSTNVAGQYNPSPLPLVLGTKVRAADGTATDMFRGMVRAVRISRLPLYSQDFSPPADFAGGPTMVAVFKFTEGHGDTIHDIANKKIFGEIHGAEWVRLDESGQE